LAKRKKKKGPGNTIDWVVGYTGRGKVGEKKKSFKFKGITKTMTRRDE
jgi:hypothetical protein